MKRIKITYACDYCGGIIGPDEDVCAITPGKINCEHKFIPKHDRGEAEVLHYHDYCLENLLAMKYKGPENTEIPADTKLDQKNPKGKSVDSGKIMALAKAGRSAKWIAEDMGIGLSTVYNHLNKMKEGA